jgi:hypothetical protein
MKHNAISTIISFSIFLAVLCPSVRASSAQGSCADNYEPNNRPGQAKTLRAGSTQGTICPTGDTDWYSFRMQSGDSIELNLTNAPADFDLALYTSNFEQVAVSDNSGTSSEAIQWTANSDDLYYAEVYAYGNSIASQSLYNLRLQFVESPDIRAQQLHALFPEMNNGEIKGVIELVGYAPDAAACFVEIKGWKKIGMIAASSPDVINSCGQALQKIAEVMGKYVGVNTDVVGGMANCADISSGHGIQGTISDSTTEESYCFEVAGRPYVTISMSDMSNWFGTTSTLDTLIRLFDEQGNKIGENDNGVNLGTDSFLRVQLPGSGIYRIVATRHSGTGDYWLSFDDGTQ